MWHSQPWPTTTPPQSTLTETPAAPTAMRRMSCRSILDGREVNDGDVNKGERFLLHSGQDGRLSVFCMATECERTDVDDYEYDADADDEMMTVEMKVRKTR